MGASKCGVKENRDGKIGKLINEEVPKGIGS